jgi:FKBP-type peptidyl-prolyl cis-trans isomerase FklB
MRKIHFFGILFLSAIIAFSGCTKKAKKVKLSSFNDSVSYAIGANIGKNLRMDLKRNNIMVDWNLLSKALISQMIDTVDMFTEDQKRMILEKFQAQMQQKEMKKQQQEMVKQQAQASENKKKGEEFLAENKKKPGIITTPSGLQYKIIKKGTGKTPSDTDVVTVNYEGKLINGIIFDSSYPSKQPVSFKLNEVIKGWIEGLKLIRENGKIELYIPSDIGYGDHAMGDKIPPGSTLIFQVELIKVGPPPKGNEEAERSLRRK